MALKQFGRTVFGRIGLQIEPSYHSLSAHRSRVLAEFRISRVIDVGANVGQYALGLRETGYSEEIISFEANPTAASRLIEAASEDRLWRVEPFALGSSQGETALHTTVDSLSTSLLAPMAADSYAFMRELPELVTVEVRTLDSFDLARDKVSTLLKLDVQGFELEVLKGGKSALAEVAAVECELSLVPLYDGQALLEDVVGYLRQSGLHPISFPRGFTDPTTHEVIQVDGLFVRTRT